MILSNKRSHSARRQKAYEAAEEVCRHLRTEIMAKREYDKTGNEMHELSEYLLKWMDTSGKKSKYAPPKPLNK